ncbi:MAG: acyl-CoA thioesterase, partial [Lachnospiraceae bacterium]|nr:acyl-CoA thioesterase [Lachnospiraceae bacterium]
MIMKEIKPYERNVYYYETDTMNIVHHSNYIRMFEEARIDFMEQIGMPYSVMEEKGIIIPVISVDAKFKTSLKFGDTFRVNMKLVKYTGVTFKCEYEITDVSDQTLYCSGSSEHCFLDNNLQLMKFKKLFPEYDALFK